MRVVFQRRLGISAQQYRDNFSSGENNGRAPD
jgi:hypothetical protein